MLINLTMFLLLSGLRSGEITKIDFEIIGNNSVKFIGLSKKKNSQINKESSQNNNIRFVNNPRLMIDL